MSQLDSKIGPKIKTFRRQLGIQANKLAAQLNISPSYLNLIEGGKRKIDGDMLLKVCEELKIELELKDLADVGLIGFPNAGKSTFISKVSNARPKIADYPFSTLVPNLGIVKYGDFQSFVMADIPGLIKGASDGKGLGSQFLRHIERTKVLVYLIECIDEEIYENFVTLKNELKKHNPDLIKRPSLLLLTKTDLIPTELLELEKVS